MKVSKSQIKHILQIIFSWVFLNFALNLLGLWFSKILDKEGFIYLDSISNEFVKPILIQSSIFAVIFSLSYLFLKNKKLSYYVFTLFQTIVFHVILFLNLKFKHGFYFKTTMSDWGLQYLGYNWQYMVDIVNIYLPINGKFDSNLFMPANPFVFYLQWIFLVLAYFGGLTWVSIKFAKFFFGESEPQPIMPQVVVETDSTEE